MKKSLKKQLKKWNIGDYVRQFSIVTGGVLLTLWLTAKIADSAKQREVRQAMQLVALELRDNLQVIQDYKWMYNDEKRVAYRLKEHDFSLDGLPADTVAYYTRRITGSRWKFTISLSLCRASGSEKTMPPSFCRSSSVPRNTSPKASRMRRRRASSSRRA